ncbi:MAG: penicillin-binding protein activator [Thermoanaerobaculia bacterium]|nr:penicillin-binding protein activator [Thermoanaerobaculia bacterium]
MKRRSIWTAVLCVGLGLGLFLGACGPPKPVTFGAVLPLTGPVQAYATAIKRGIEIAYEQAREDPRLEREIELEIVDSETDPEKAAELLEDLYDEGALAAIGGVTSAEALEMVEVADEEDRVLVSPSASNPELSGVSRNFFRVFPSDFVEGTKMGSFAANTLKLESAVILANESPYGLGIQEVFETEFERHGGEVLETLEFQSNTDVSGLVDRVTTLAPDAVYLAAYWKDLVHMIRELRGDGYEGKILTTSAFATSRAVREVGDQADGVIFTQTIFDLSQASGDVKAFVDTYREKYGETPDLYSAHGYDAMRVLVEALVEGGATPNEFWGGMRSIRSLPGATGTLQFDEKGDVQKYPRVYIIKDGEPLNYERHVERIKRAFQERMREIEERQRRLEGEN